MTDISNQLAPIKVRENQALYNLTNFICEMIQLQKQLQQNEQIEIEGRLGNFVQKDFNDQETLYKLEFIKQVTSKQGMQLLNTMIPELYRFESDVEESKFETSLSYLEKNHNHIIYYQKFFEINDIKDITKTQDDLILDLALEQNVRISYTVNKNKFEVITKESDHNHVRDIVHNGICFRISAKKEIDQGNLNIQELIQKKQIRSFRFKQRKSFSYQFMEISLTRVLQVEKEKNQEGYFELINGLTEEILNPEMLNKKALRFYSKFFLKKDPNQFSKKREIEIEITNLKSFFNDEKKIIEMKIRAFMKNIQLLDMLKQELIYVEENQQLKDKYYNQDKVFHEKSQIEEQFKFREPLYDIAPPEIGEYMKKELHNFILKNQVPDKKTLKNLSSH